MPTAGGTLMRGTLGGSSSSGTLNNLIASLDSQSQAAKTDQLAQYNNLLNSVAATKKSILGKGGMYSKAGAMLANQGVSAKADIDEQTKNQLGSTEQDLISRGLGNTTIRSNMLNGVQRQGQREKTRVDESVAAARAGLLERQAGMASQLGGLEADSILSKSIEGPDLSQYLNLIAQLSAANTSRAAATTPRTMFSNMGSVTALNGGSSFNSAGASAGGASATSSSPAGGAAGTGAAAGEYYRGSAAGTAAADNTVTTPADNQSAYEAELGRLRASQGIVYDSQYRRLKDKYGIR